MRRLLAVVALATACRTSALDAGDVTGTVTLPGAQPAEGALITVAGQAEVADGVGAFAVLDVPFGDHELTVLLDGYAPYTEALTVNSLTGATLDVELVPLGIDANRPPLVSALSVAPPQLLPSGTAEVLVTAADPDGDPLTYTWTADEGFEIVAGTSAGTAVVTAPGTEGTTGTITVDVTDPDGAVGTASVYVTTVQASSNRAPAIATLGVSPPLLSRDGTATALVSALDPDGDTLQYTWTVDGGFTVSSSDDTATITAPDAYDAEGLLTVVVSDGRGLEAEASMRVTTAANRVPVIGALSVSPPTLAPSATAKALVTATDPDGDLVTVTWTASGGFLAASTGASSADLTAPATFGASGTLLVEVSDGIGTSSATVLLGTAASRPPAFGSLSLAPPQLAPGGTSVARAVASDPDGGVLTWTWSATGGFTVVGSSPGTATVTAPATSGASGTLTATATDAQGNGASSTVGVTTTANGGPILSALSVSPSILASAGSAAALISVTDPDADLLTVTWSATGGFTATTSGSYSATVAAPAASGAAGTVTASVFDGTHTAAGTVAVSTASNRAPVFSSLAVSQTQLAPSGTAQAVAVAADPEGGVLTWSWIATGGFAVTPGSAGTATITAPASPGAAGTVTVTATDPGSAIATATALVQTTTPVNAPPQIASVSVSPPVIAPLATANVLVAASDPDGDDLGYAYSVTGGFSVVGSGTTAVVTAPAGNAASGTLTVIVTDDNDGSTTAAVLVRTTERVNSAPILQSLVATPPIVMKLTTLTLTAAAVDPNNDPLTWTWQTPSGWTPTGTGSTIALQAPNTPGVSGTVRVTANDGNGGTASGSIVVSTWPNRAPVIANLSVVPAEPEPGEGMIARVSAEDADGDVLTYAWVGVPGTWVVSAQGPGEADVTAPAQTGEDGTLRVVVSDAFGGQATAEVVVRTSGCFADQLEVDGRCVWCGQAGVAAKGPLLYWTLGEAAGTTASDHSGNGFHGTWLASTGRGSLTLVSDGDPGGVFTDSLTSGVISAGAVSWPDVHAFGVSLWVKTTDTGSGIVSYASAGSDNDFLLFGPENLSLWVLNTSVSTGVAINDGRRHHVVYTWHSHSGAVSLWVDGVLRYSGTLQVGLHLTSGGRLVVGQDQDTVGGGFDVAQAFAGDLDDVALFHDFLDDEAVQELFSGQVCEACNHEDNDEDGVVDEVVMGMDPSCPALTCKSLQTNSSRGSGEWWIDPGLGNGNGAYELPCDMGLSGGGWTVVPQTKYFPFAIFTEGDSTERYVYRVPDAYLTALKARSTEGSQTWACATVGVNRDGYQANWVVFSDATTSQFAACQAPDNLAMMRSSGTVTTFSQLPAREWHPEDCGDWTESCQHNFGDLYLR